jgi:hypothetical protein
MAKPKRKLTTAQKMKKAQFTTIFINGKQRRVRRPVLIDGLDPDKFYLRNADSIALQQDARWECIAEAEHGDIAVTDANGVDCLAHSG